MRERQNIARIPVEWLHKKLMT